MDNPSVSIKYVEGVIKLDCCSSAIHSFLILLYMEMADEEQPSKFLSSQVPSASVASDASRKASLGAFAGKGLSSPLDMPFAL